MMFGKRKSPNDLPRRRKTPIVFPRPSDFPAAEVRPERQKISSARPCDRVDFPNGKGYNFSAVRTDGATSAAGSDAIGSPMKIVEKLKHLFRPMDLTQGKCWKVILSFSLPIILSYLLQQLYTVSDAAICGQTLTDDQVAGVNDVNPLLFIFLQFAFGCSAGFCVVSSQAVGKRDKEGTRRSLATQIMLSAVITLILTAVALALLDPLLAWLNVTPETGKEVYDAAYIYCFIVFAGIGAQMFYNLICSFLRSVGDSLSPLAFLLFSTLLNVGLDLLFILVFGWGVVGAAVATVTAQLFSTVACFVYTFVKYKDLRLHRADFRLTKRDVGEHLAQGLPLALQFSVLAIGIIVMQSGVVLFDITDCGMTPGKPAQNGFGAANKLCNLLMTPLNALGAGMTSFCAQNLGAGDTKRVRQGVNQAMLIMTVMSVALTGIGLLLTLGGAYLYLFLSPDKIGEATVRYGNIMLYTDLPLYFFLGTIFVLRSSVQGIGKSAYVLGAGVAELTARVLICLLLPVAVNGGPITAAASDTAFFTLILGDPAAWIASDLVLLVPYINQILRGNYKYLRRRGLTLPLDENK